MDKNDILKYYDYLCRLSSSKCDSQESADDMVSETILAALAYISGGGIIEYPKTWLANTLMHKINNELRRKYHMPVIVQLDSASNVASDNSYEDVYLKSDEAAEVRRELTYLAKANREVLIRYYFKNESVDDIARALNIPAGTVKSRLSSGRFQIKKGLEEMEDYTNILPAHLNIAWGGSDGPNGEPSSLVENDLIAQNMLIAAYEKPLKLTEIAKALGVPTAYIEPVAQKLTDGELMVKTDGDRYYTDFILYDPSDKMAAYKPQREFVEKHFDAFWKAMSFVISEIDRLEYSKTLNERQLKKLERYAVLHTLQNFTLCTLSSVAGPMVSPRRKDGGAWTAHGTKFPEGFNFKEYNEITWFTINGGHRTNVNDTDIAGAKSLMLCEFDTFLWDNPSRFWVCGHDAYFEGIAHLLWCIYSNERSSKSDTKDAVDYAKAANWTGVHRNVKNALIESIPKLEKHTGLIAFSEHGISVDIPVMSDSEYGNICKIVSDGKAMLDSELGGALRDFIKNSAISVPQHLKSVPGLLKYKNSTEFIEMSAVYEAYERKLHLHDVDYCCPPVVLVYTPSM